MNKKKDLELYIHIPFCKRKCKYCDFLSGPASELQIAEYFENLKKEIAQSVKYPLEDYQVSTVFFGGGTPSNVASHYIKEVMDALFQVFSFAPKEKTEITIEANPGTLTEEKLKTYKEAGINRISMGLQSAQNEELELLGRIHTYEEFLENYYLARKCGFTNINIDLMSALPGQTLEDWERTLQKVTALKPEHISAYSLIIEEGTAFYDIYKEHEELLPDEETERKIYYRTREVLKDNGYMQYELSNYTKPSYACRHNLGYWERVPYLGFGLGAASLFEEVRYQNPRDFSSYKQYVLGKIKREEESLTKNEQMEEFMFLGLRKTEGVSEKQFEEQFQRKIDAIYGETIEKFQKQKLLERENGRIYLSNRGMDLANYVMAEFLLS